MSNITEVNNEELIEFLDNLKDSGSINMMGAAPHIQEEFYVNRREAQILLMRWIGLKRG